MTKEQLTKVFKLVNPNENSEINYAELIYFLRDKISSQRNDLIQSTFDRLDVRKEGEILIDQLLAKNEDRQRAEAFEKAVDDYCHFQGIDDGIFTDEDFSDFFGFIGFPFDESDFQLYMTCAFPDD